MGSEHLEMGAEAERWTSELLGGRRTRWHVVNDLVFDQRNIDHVVVGPRGVAAVETKWCGARLYPGPQRLPNRRDVEQALWSARKVSLLARTRQLTCEPLPVLVYWGPGAASVEAAVTPEGVLVAHGRRDAKWLRALLAERIGDGRADGALKSAIVQHGQVVGPRAKRRKEPGRRAPRSASEPLQPTPRDALGASPHTADARPALPSSRPVSTTSVTSPHG
jgi:hypothetical protein